MICPNEARDGRGGADTTLIALCRCSRLFNSNELGPVRTCSDHASRVRTRYQFSYDVAVILREEVTGRVADLLPSDGSVLGCEDEERPGCVRGNVVEELGERDACGEPTRAVSCPEGREKNDGSARCRNVSDA